MRTGDISVTLAYGPGASGFLARIIVKQQIFLFYLILLHQITKREMHFYQKS